jgi:hypothetical protein
MVWVSGPSWLTSRTSPSGSLAGQSSEQKTSRPFQDAGCGASWGWVVAIGEVSGRVMIEGIETANLIVWQTEGSNLDRIRRRDRVSPVPAPKVEPKPRGQLTVACRAQVLIVGRVPKVEGVTKKHQRPQAFGRGPVGPMRNRRTLALTDHDLALRWTSCSSSVQVGIEQRRSGSDVPGYRDWSSEHEIALLIGQRVHIQTPEAAGGDRLPHAPCQSEDVRSETGGAMLRIAAASKSDQLDVRARPLGRRSGLPNGFGRGRRSRLDPYHPADRREQGSRDGEQRRPTDPANAPDGSARSPAAPRQHSH